MSGQRAASAISSRARARSRIHARARGALACAAALALATPLLSAVPLRPRDRLVPVTGNEIVNVATCEANAADGAPLEVRSNPARTPVLSGACAGTVLLTLEPAGEVHPGDTLLHVARAQASASTVVSPVLALHVAEGIVLPADTGAALVTDLAGAPLAFTGSVDVPGRRLLFALPDLAPAEGAIVRIPLQVSPAAPSLGPLESFVELRAAGCSEGVSDTGDDAEIVPFGLTLRKRADRPTAWPGDAVGYALDLAADTGAPAMAATTVVDVLPDGFRYVPGSARVDGAVAADPVTASDGRTQRFAVGPLGPGTVRHLTYAAAVGATAREGEAVNRARAEGRLVDVPSLPPAAVSPEAAAAVLVRPGPFRREAVLAGRVFVDDDGDGVPGANEPGVPGVLVVLEDGRGAVTDPTGRWHLPGVPPGLHVVRADPATLPRGLVPVAAGAAWAGSAASRFVEVRAAALEIVDLPLGSGGSDRVARCSIGAGARRVEVPAASLLLEDGAVLPGAQTTVEAVAETLADLLPAVGSDLTCTGSLSDAAGLVPLRRALSARLASRAPAAAATAPTAAPRAADPLEEVVRTHAPVAAIVSPASGTRADRSRVDVEVAYPAGTVPELRVGGEVVPEARIGTRSVLPSRGIEAARFVGVPLAPGANRVELRATEPGGRPSEVAAAEIELILPGDAVELRLSVVGERLLAGGEEPGALRVEALDAFGVRAAWAGLATVSLEGASPLDPDADVHEDGFQVRLVDGAAEISLASPPLPGQLHAFARTDRLEAELVAPIAAQGGAWQVVGVAEANAAGAGGVEGHGGEPPGLDRGIADGGGRVAFFGRGALSEGAQLTVSVDTARRRDPDRLFEAREPEATFPVHGDSSAGSDAIAHQGPVYLRLDTPSGFAQWGDEATGLDRTELSRYDRRLSGLTGELRRGTWGARAFAAPTDARVVRDVFAPDGTSGPYLLSRTPIVLRSERIVIETRDRFRTDEVVARRTLVPALDYDLDVESGALLLSRAVTPFDGEHRPQRLVLLYEARTGGQDPVAAGVRVDAEPLPGLTLGSTAVVEGREGDDLSLFGVDLRWRPRPGIVLRAEAAQADDGSGPEEAMAAALTSRGPRLAWELSFRDLPAGFANPTYLGSPDLGSRRTAARASWQPSEAWRLRGEAYAQDTEAGIERSAVKVDAERKLGPVTALAGLARVGSEDAAGDRSSATMASAGLRARPAPRWTTELLRQQSLGSADVPGYPDRTSLGVGFDLDDRTRLTLRQEWESGGALPGSDRTVLGLEGRVSEHTRALARYTLEEGEGGAALRASAGVETVWPLSPATRVTASASRTDTRRGDPRADFTALAAGWERRAGRSLASGRYEVRLGEEERRHLGTLTAAYRLREPLTLFASERLFATDAPAGSSARRVEGRLGAAWRPRVGAWQVLARLDHAIGGGDPFTAGGTLPGGVPSEPGTSAGLVDPPAPAVAGIGTEAPRAVPAVRRDAIALSLAAGFRPTVGHRLAGTLVFRHVAADPLSGVPGTATSLVSLHYTADLGRRATLSGSLRRFHQDLARTTAHGAGLEAGWLVLRDVWVVGGYNVAGFSDGGFADAGRTDRGPFAALRIKFDETTLSAWRDLRLDRP